MGEARLPLPLLLPHRVLPEVLDLGVAVLLKLRLSKL